MSSYLHKGIDIESIFEPWEAGDPKVPNPVGHADANVDKREVFVPLALGARYTEDVGYGSLGLDFRDIFAVKGSVPRFKKPLPWDNTFAAAATIYRQPSRPLTTEIQVAVDIKSDGRVWVTATTPNQHSNPNGYTNTTQYALTSPPAWDKNRVPAGVFFEVKFDVVSGPQPNASIPFGTWVALDGTPANAVLANNISYSHSSTAEGAKTRNSQVRISVRRSDYPDSNKADAVVKLNLSLNVLASLFASTAPFTQNYSQLVTGNMPSEPEGWTAQYAVSTTYELRGNGTIQIMRAITDLDGIGPSLEVITAPWRRAMGSNDTSIDDFEMMFTSGVGTIYNTAPTWTSINANTTQVLTMYHEVGNDLPPGNYSQTSTGAFIIRQKSTKGYVAADNYISGALKSSTTIKIGEAVLPDWDSVSLPNLITSRSVNIDYSKPNRWEVAGVQYIMGHSSSKTAKNVVGNSYSQTTDNISNPTEPVNIVQEVLTRICPGGYQPNWFEWRYRVLNGAADGPNEGVWRGMENASYIVQVSKSINHGSAAGQYTAFADLAIDVRRLSAPDQVHTYTTRLEASITLVANGPNWNGMVLGDMSVVQGADSGINSSWQASIGMRMGSSTDVTAKHIYQRVWNFAGNVSSGVELTPYKRIVPEGYSPNDFEWKYEVVSTTGTGAVDSDLAANTWGDVGASKYLNATTLADKVVGADMQQQTFVANLKVTVRHKVQTGWVYTFPQFKLIASIQWQAPPFTLWPREDYQGWAGTYYHTSNHELESATPTPSADLEGVTYSQGATWSLSFHQDGSWAWNGNGSTSYKKNGYWNPTGIVDGRHYSIRATVETGYGYTTNLRPGWNSLAGIWAIDFNINYPPRGEPNNTGLWVGLIEVVDDNTGLTVSSVRRRIDVSSIRTG